MLRRFSTAPAEDLETLVRALALNWVAGGTDAHAKNFSLLLAPGQVRLAPLYDIASVLPYPRQVPPQKARLAMRVGREYQLRKIERRHWERLGEEVGTGAEAALEHARAVVQAIPGRMAEVCADARAAGLDHPVVERLEQSVEKHAAACMAALERGAGAGG